MGNRVLFNTAGSIALAIDFLAQGPYSDKFLTREDADTIRINAEVYIRVGDAVQVIDTDEDLTAANLDAGAAFGASTTYYIYACHPLDGSLAPVFRISENATYPAGGWDADDSRRIGEFQTDGSGDIVDGSVADLRTEALDGMASDAHASTHKTSGADEIDGDQLDIDFTPSHYTPDTTPTEVTSADHLSAHLAGIDNALAQVAMVAAYGVRWNAVTDVMTPGVIINSQFVLWEYTQMPVHDKCGQRCVMDASNVVQYYLHPDDSTQKADGQAANIDGTDGQVMSEFQQFHHIRKNDGNYRYMLVGERPFNLTLSDASVIGSKVHDWFDEGGTRAEKKYLGAFEGVLYDDTAGSYVGGTGGSLYAAGDKLHSVSGYIPMTYVTRGELRTAAAVDGDYHQMGFWALEALLLLFVTKYQDWNSQTLLPGYTEGGTWDLAKRCKTGITAALGNHDGSISWNDADSGLRCTTNQGAVIVANSFLGVENFYGHVWKWIDGVNIQFVGAPLTEAALHVCNNPANWADDTTTNYIDTGVDLPLANGYQTDLHDGMMTPSAASGGGSATFITDYYWASAAAGWRVLYSSGALYDGAIAGAAARYANNASSSRNASIGGRSAA